MEIEIPEYIAKVLFGNRFISRINSKISKHKLYDFIRRRFRVRKKYEGSNVFYKVSSKKELDRWCSLMQEKKVIDYICGIIKTGDVFIDIGANIGIYSCCVLSKGEASTVVSVEPEKNNYQSLKRNLVINSSKSTWIALNQALADYDGYTNLSTSSTTPGAGSHHLSSNGNQKVKVSKAKTLIERGIIPTPDVVKVDVEGDELKCLKGLEELVKSARSIICEVHNKNENYDKFKSFAASIGFETSVVHERPEEWDDIHISMTNN